MRPLLFAHVLSALGMKRHPLRKITTLVLPVVAAILSLCLEHQAHAAEATSKPNIVLILADDK